MNREQSLFKSTLFKSGVFGWFASCLTFAFSHALIFAIVLSFPSSSQIAESLTEAAFHFFFWFIVGIIVFLVALFASGLYFFPLYSLLCFIIVKLCNRPNLGLYFVPIVVLLANFYIVMPIAQDRHLGAPDLRIEIARYNILLDWIPMILGIPVFWITFWKNSRE